MIQSPELKPTAFKPLTFIKESVVELKKVVWPTKQQVVKLTLVVIVVSLLTGLYIGGLDYLFTQIMGLLVK